MQITLVAFELVTWYFSNGHKNLDTHIISELRILYKTLDAVKNK
jgi:hypothetical protein